MAALSEFPMYERYVQFILYFIALVAGIGVIGLYKNCIHFLTFP